MRKRPAKIDLRLDHLSIPDRQQVSVSEPAARAESLVRYKDLITVWNDAYKLVPRDRFAIRPTPREIGRPVNPVIERAREMEVVGNQGLYRRPILISVGDMRGAPRQGVKARNN